MLFEPAGTVNTGTAGGDLTVAEPERIQRAAAGSGRFQVRIIRPVE